MWIGGSILASLGTFQQARLLLLTWPLHLLLPAAVERRMHAGPCSDVQQICLACMHYVRAPGPEAARRLAVLDACMAGLTASQRCHNSTAHCPADVDVQGRVPRVRRRPGAQKGALRGPQPLCAQGSMAALGASRSRTRNDGCSTALLLQRKPSRGCTGCSSVSLWLRTWQHAPDQPPCVLPSAAAV